MMFDGALIGGGRGAIFMAMMIPFAKPARAPSEEAHKLADMLWWILGSGGSARQGAITEAAAHIDEHVAHRLSTALLNPSEEAMTYGRAYLIGCLFAAGWSDVEFRKIPVEALQTAFDASFRAAAMKITGHE